MMVIVLSNGVEVSKSTEAVKTRCEFRNLQHIRTIQVILESPHELVTYGIIGFHKHLCHRNAFGKSYWGIRVIAGILRCFDFLVKISLKTGFSQNN